MRPNFSETFFGENVAWDPAQFLAKTWCPYLFWVLRNLPHKFEKLAHVPKSAKKNVTIWASRKARAPKTPSEVKLGENLAEFEKNATQIMIFLPHFHGRKIFNYQSF